VVLDPKGVFFGYLLALVQLQFLVLSVQQIPGYGVPVILLVFSVALIPKQKAPTHVSAFSVRDSEQVLIRIFFVFLCFFVFPIPLLQEFSLILPIAGPIDFHDDRVMEDPIKDGIGCYRVSQELEPVLFFDI